MELPFKFWEVFSIACPFPSIPVFSGASERTAVKAKRFSVMLLRNVGHWTPFCLKYMMESGHLFEKKATDEPDVLS